MIEYKKQANKKFHTAKVRLNRNNITMRANSNWKVVENYQKI